MKKIITLKTNDTSILATQKYGDKRQRKKPQNKSILGAYKYGNSNIETKGSKKHGKKYINKNK